MSKKLTPFPEFVKSLHETAPQAHAKATDAKVISNLHLDEMRKHLLHLYDGVQANHSFMDEIGQTWDCIPVDQQPSLKGTGKKAAVPPPSIPDKLTGREASAGGEDHKANVVSTQIGSGRKDAHGNVMDCPVGCIPMRRITLEELSRFETLEKFFKKSPFDGGGQPFGREKVELKDIPLGGPPPPHKWAHASQAVNNLGGESYLNVWEPAVNNTQIFSLSQHWYTAGSYPNTLQTVECGWQVYPGKYGTQHPCLFIYWTRDAYKTTGNYNLDASAFVQTNHAYTIGGPLLPVSTYNSGQYELKFSFYLYQGNWWLYLNGGLASNAIGYYPGSLFAGGPLANHATSIDYGGEVCSANSFPPMGSGHWPAEGFGKACFHRNVRYYATGGGVANSSLTPQVASPACFKVVQFNSGSWAPGFYFGGPGGVGC